VRWERRAVIGTGWLTRVAAESAPQYSMVASWAQPETKRIRPGHIENCSQAKFFNVSAAVVADHDDTLEVRRFLSDDEAVALWHQGPDCQSALNVGLHAETQLIEKLGF
jgi:hypothetical protein